ncbi:hypothetical protein COO60DRAFT_1037842 [Scenedesmus sp. NREL 46B-D3]|nr:hypothetical protein COO60DRAFT_1037842 [Scenedesmus sp. NREL 46B-D3]
MDGSAFTSSADRLRQLAMLSEPISWVARTFVVGGDALLKLRLSPDLQLVIRDVISNSVAQSTNVPASQVLTFAAANVSLSLGFKGVGFGSTDSRATADNHAGLAAVRDALSQLAGGFDHRHIAVSFAPPSVPDQGTTAAGAGTGRRMLAAGQGQQQQQQLSSGATKLVNIRLFSVDPANTTSIVSALSKDCTPPAATSNSSLADPAGLVPGLQVPPICEAIFGMQFVKHSVPVSFTALSVTPTEKPQAIVSLSVAVGLTADQTADGLTVNSTANWLNSTALRDMLFGLNLSVQTLPTDYVSAVQLTAAHNDRSSSMVKNSNLSGLLSNILALPTPPPAPQPPHDAARGVVVSKGMLAGIIVAAVTSVLALLGVALLLLMRRSQSVQRAGRGELPTGEANRRRRKKRVYNNKFIPAGLAAADGAAVSDGPSSSQHPAAARPHLERGDSVTSAIRNEADDDEAAESAEGRTEDRQHHEEAGGASSCSSAAAGRASSSSSSSSTSSRATGSLAQQRAVELRVMRAAGVPDSSASVAVAHGADDGGQWESVMWRDRPASSRSYCSGALSAGPLLLVVPCKQVSEAEGQPALVGKRLQQPEQSADAGRGGSAAAACGGTSDNVADAFAAMEAQLAAKAAGSSSSSRPVEAGVQPLGQSCWHAGSRSADDSYSNSSSRCSLEPRQGGWPTALPHEQQLQQQWQQRQQQQPKHAAAGSPFAHQQEQKVLHQHCTSGSIMASPFTLHQQLRSSEEEQQQQQQSQSSSGQAMLSPFAAAKMLV